MPTAAMSSYYWADQGEAPVQGPVLTAMARVLGPPLLALFALLFSAASAF